MDMRYGTWNVGKLYGAESRKTVASELANYKLDRVTVQEVKWDKGSYQPTNCYTFFYGYGSANHHLRTDFIAHNGIISAVKMVEFISDKMLYVTLRVRWCDIIFPECTCANR
jgi:exonuclease III